MPPLDGDARLHRTIDEPAVSFHTPETKQQSKLCTKKIKLGPIKAKVHVTRSKLMVLAFFNNKGLIYINYVPRGKTVNANYIVKALSRVLTVFKKKRLNMAAREWFVYWGNAPIYKAAIVKDWVAAKDFRLIEHPPIRWTSLRWTCSCSRPSRGSGEQDYNPEDLRVHVEGGCLDHRLSALV